MKLNAKRSTALLIALTGLLSLAVPGETLAGFESTVHAVPLAYVGPGAGLGAIGALLAVLGAVAIGLFGIVLYPIHLLRSRLRREQDDATTTTAESSSESNSTV